MTPYLYPSTPACLVGSKQSNGRNPPDAENRNPELKRLAIAAVHRLLALEATALAVMLMIGVLATLAADITSKDAPPRAYQSGYQIQPGKSPNIPNTDLPPNACMANQLYC